MKFEHLWAGASAGRCNPPGVSRVYMSLERKTAQVEYEQFVKKEGLDPDLSDSYSFTADIKLARVLDLRSDPTLTVVGLIATDIEEEWEEDPLCPRMSPTRLQSVGYWISQSYGNFSGIILPSVRGPSGNNIVIFKERVIDPDFVRPLSSTPTKGWPS
jgi:RES domain-containing protein